MGMPDAIRDVFPGAKHQRCLVHIQRNLSQGVRVRDRKDICNDFKNVYGQETKEKTLEEFESFANKWATTYPRLVEKLRTIGGLFEYLNFPKCMWKAIRTTNYIESFNADLQRYSNHRILFNSETNEIIVLTACIADYNNSAKKNREKYLSELTEEEKCELGFEILPTLS